MPDKLINLAVAGPFYNSFTYKIRAADAHHLQKGCRFLVPFGKSDKIAFYTGFQNQPVKYRLKYISQRIDTFSPFNENLFDFCLWMAQYYFAGPGETLAAALPGTGTGKPKLELIAQNIAFFEGPKFESGPAAIFAKKIVRSGLVKEDFIAGNDALIPLVRKWLKEGILSRHYHAKAAGRKLIGYRLTSDVAGENQLDQLEADVTYSRHELSEQFGFSAYKITKFHKSGKLEKVYDESGVTDLSTYPIRHELPHMKLLPGQHIALDAILPAIIEKKFDPSLLYGITGSGKTMVYCHAAKKAVDQGGSVLVMVPEIALSGLLLSSFAAFFGEQVAVIHSGLSVNQRFAVRQKIASGKIKVVIGPRSAIFAPLKDIGLIIVDEEHDPSYKQNDPAPRYHGRDAAVMLAKMNNIPIILGSASPSIESYHNAVSGRYQMITLDKRPKSGYRMPEIITLDMKSEKILGECSFLSYRLKRETELHIADGGQVIYYLNRRGFSPRLKCKACGEVPICPDCGITYTYHRSGYSLKCHFCDRVEPAPENCPRCNGGEFIYLGAGTQRVEENLARLFGKRIAGPDDDDAIGKIRAERIDSDRAASKSGRLVLRDFAQEKFNLLIGTQMVTKGLDIPGVTLVGVLAADIGLDMPDFRAAEKTYARLLQVAGRAGRGDREGRVMIQTYYSDHPVIRHLTEGSYPIFYESVIAERESLYYPPFSRLIGITLSAPDEKMLETAAIRFRFKLEDRLAGLNGFRLLGPSKAPLYKLRKQNRRKLLIKCKSVKAIVNRFRKWEAENRSYHLPPKVSITFDIDPVNMM